MRTTLDLPDELLRLAKARAALRGMKLKDFVAEALESAVYYRQASSGSSKAAEIEADEETLVIDANCVLPLIRGACGPELRKLTGGKATELLENENVERAGRPRGR